MTETAYCQEFIETMYKEMKYNEILRNINRDSFRHFSQWFSSRNASNWKYIQQKIFSLEYIFFFIFLTITDNEYFCCNLIFYLYLIQESC